MNRQAKIISKKQQKVFLEYLGTTRASTRNKVMFWLSLHGLRAIEVHNLDWSMVTDSDGNVSNKIEITNKASKGDNGGRTVWLNDDLKCALISLLDESLFKSGAVVRSERGNSRMGRQSIVDFFQRHYSEIGFEGCSSHSGRRTFITRAARKISECGGSLRDIQKIVGHSALQNTQRYIEQDTAAQKKVMMVV